MIFVHFQGKPFSVTVIHDYVPTTNAEEAKFDWFYEDLQDLLELTLKQNYLFIIGNWNAKVGSQKIPGITGKFGFGVPSKAKQSKAKANRVLPREHTGHSKQPLPTTQEMTLHKDIIRWSILKSD